MHNHHDHNDNSKEDFYDLIDKYLSGKQNVDNLTDFSKPIVREALKPFLPFFVILYMALMVFGVIFNLSLIIYVLRQKLYSDKTHGFMVNLAFAHLIQCSAVLPITFLITILQNWIFGQFLCYFAPMLQVIITFLRIMYN